MVDKSRDARRRAPQIANARALLDTGLLRKKTERLEAPHFLMAVDL